MCVEFYPDNLLLNCFLHLICSSLLISLSLPNNSIYRAIYESCFSSVLFYDVKRLMGETESTKCRTVGGKDHFIAKVSPMLV